MDVEEQWVRATVDALGYAHSELTKFVGLTGKDINLRLFADLAERGERWLLPTGTPDPDTHTQQRLARLEAELRDTDFRLLVEGEAISATDEVYTFDPESIGLAWIPVASGLDGKCWHASEYMFMRRKRAVA